MKVTQKPIVYFDWTAEMISPYWPKPGVHLDLGELDDQRRLDVWRVLVERELVELRQLELDFDSRDESLPHDEKRALRTLNEVWALLHLPDKAIAAGRKHLFGIIPPIDEHDVWIFAWDELRYLAAAFWGDSELRTTLVERVRKAQLKHDRRTRAARLLSDLQNEL